MRTIYRDLKALEQAGIPILTEEGKGFTLMEGYRVPPIMFTENEANALILAEQLVLKNKDRSFVKNYQAAVDKVKAVLKQEEKEKANLLADRTQFEHIMNKERNSENISELQYALTNYLLVRIDYTNQNDVTSARIIEPFALLSTNENWLLVAWCRLRKEFRYFRIDRIQRTEILQDQFEPHNMTLQKFFDKYH